MWIEIIVARAAYPIVGAVINIPESIAEKLIEGKLAKEASAPSKKMAKPNKPNPDDK